MTFYLKVSSGSSRVLAASRRTRTEHLNSFNFGRDFPNRPSKIV